MTEICEVRRCKRVQHSTGLCDMHYSRRRRTGDPLGRSGKPEPRADTTVTKGLGKILCAYCRQPVRDHEMRPCPTSGVDLFKAGEGVSSEGLRRRRYRRKGGR